MYPNLTADQQFQRDRYYGALGAGQVGNPGAAVAWDNPSSVNYALDPNGNSAASQQQYLAALNANGGVNATVGGNSAGGGNFSMVGGGTGGQYGGLPGSQGSQTPGMAAPWDAGGRGQFSYTGGTPNFNEQTGQYGGGGGVGGTGPGYGGGNPYLEQQGNAIFNRLNDNFTRNTLPAIRSGAMAAGGFGGSRQGVIEANALNDMNRNAGDAYANLMGTDWTNQQNRNLQNKSLDQNYSLGWGGLNNQRYGMDQNFYTQQRGQDQSGALLGANLFTSGMSGEWDPLKNANSIYGNYTGFGNTTQSGQQGGGWQGAAGGLIAGSALGRQAGWW